MAHNIPEIVLDTPPWHGMANPTRGKFFVGQKTIFTLSTCTLEVEITKCFLDAFGGPAYLLKFPDGSEGRFRENEIY